MDMGQELRVIEVDMPDEVPSPTQPAKALLAELRRRHETEQPVLGSDSLDSEAVAT